LIKIIDFESIDHEYVNLYDGLFEPETLTIYIDKNIKNKYPFWRRMLIAVLIHEFVHLLEYIFICKCNLGRFKSLKNPEYKAEYIENIALKLMGIIRT